MRRVAACLGPVFLAVLLLPRGGATQERASLDQVETLIARGRVLQAREVLESWWEEQGASVGRLDRQRSLWLRARLTVDPSLAELDLRRLVLEFPGGPFSDDALLRLAQAAESRGDQDEAFVHYTALVRGYPGSAFAAAARDWLDREGPGVEARRAEEAPPPEEKPPSTPPDSVGGFSVQVGAFRRLEGALALAEDLRVAGFEPRVVTVPKDGLIRVRVGKFLVREGAESLRRSVETSGFEATLVTDAQSEERVR